jgi:hypothetical protein
MSDRKTETTLLGYKLRLPVQAAPIDRSTAGSSLVCDSGVQPALFMEIGIALGMAIDAYFGLD